MPVSTAGQVCVAPNVVLDGRLALFHRKERWLAVADLHFGYELSQRVAGRLVPLWGMKSIERRLIELLEHYRPRRLILLGDLVHDAASGPAAKTLLRKLQKRCQVVTLAGNHDRHVAQAIQFEPRWETPGFIFHHGNCAVEDSDRVQVIGHHHPAAILRDGAGLRLKLPAFVQEERSWIMPAFSPWAGGVAWPNDGESHIWVCTPGRVLRVEANSLSG